MRSNSGLLMPPVRSFFRADQKREKKNAVENSNLPEQGRGFRQANRFYNFLFCLPVAVLITRLPGKNIGQPIVAEQIRATACDCAN